MDWQLLCIHSHDNVITVGNREPWQDSKNLGLAPQNMWANDIHYSTCVHTHVTYPYPTHTHTHTSQVFGPCLLAPVVMTLSLVEVEWAILSSVDISTRESDSGTWGIYVLIETVCLLHAVYNVFDLYYRTATPNDIALQGKVTSLDLFPGKNYSFLYPVSHTLQETHHWMLKQ